MLFEDIDSMVKFYAAQTPYKVALIQGEKKFSYYELYELAKALACQLQHAQLQNQCIALHLPNSLELVVAYLGCFMAGAIAVPLNITLKSAEISYILEETTPEWLITANHSHTELDNSLAGKTSLKKIITFPAQLSKDFSIKNIPHHHKLTKAPITKPAVIFYTSGSTAKPKGVIHTQSSLLAMMDNMADCVDLTAHDRFLVSEAMSNASGCIHALLTLYKNATAILMSNFNVEEFKKNIPHKPTIISVMGKGNYDIAHDERLHRDDFASIKFNFSGGDKITKDLMQAFANKTGIPIRLGYGMSEFLLITINKTRDENKLTSVGQVSKHVSIKLLNAKSSAVLPNEIGEIWVKGDNCMQGYWHNPELTQETLVDGWLRTGDLAKCDSDGYYWIQGRIKQMIIRDTENISPLEIEDVLAAHPAVKIAGVIGIPDPLEGEVPKAFVELKAHHSATEAELLAFIKERLEDFKVPVAIIIVDQLPRTKNGKIAREELRKLA
jgi:long-chain acyl-CoA synthetase